MTPHAELVVDDTQLKSNGRVVAKAGPGLGYTYKWSGEGINQPEFAANQSRYELTVSQGTKKEIKVTVRNVFGFESEATAVVDNPKPPTQRAPMPAPAPRGGQ